MEYAGEDVHIRATNDDAAVSRCSASKAGYFADPFIPLFVKRAERRSPVINRGSYCRFIGIQNVIQQFLRACKQCDLSSQIVVLGSGSDTTYFLLKETDYAPTRFVEIDFPEITSVKCMKLHRNSRLRSLLPEGCQTGRGGAELYSDQYTILAGDLRQFESDIVPRLLETGLRSDVPTLFLSECVLIYLDPQFSDRLIASVSQQWPSAFFVTYEQIQPHDAFGQMMTQNLQVR
ncbi:carboxy methyl transferase for protein phosphatase 2A [Dimargaris cristalligena]|nr:carboxy methyl transferase for protein phosphatase 2A [Dimargaris cristalligena]